MWQMMQSGKPPGVECQVERSYLTAALIQLEAMNLLLEDCMNIFGSRAAFLFTR